MDATQHSPRQRAWTAGCRKAKAALAAATMTVVLSGVGAPPVAAQLTPMRAAPGSGSASVRTANFLISAPTPQLAQQVGEAAEKYRRELSHYWLGYEISRWSDPCPIRVVAGPTLLAQGVTHYDIEPVRNFRMKVEGTPERILDSVLPHEITHTILATHFGRPLPRWADEGICTIVEHEAEKSKHETMLRRFLRTQRGIAMNKLFLLREYPDDIHAMYAQGFSVCRFLVEQQGPRTFIKFLESYMQQSSWTNAVQEHYGYDSLAELQQYWVRWVGEGGGPVDRYAKVDRDARAGGQVRLAAAEAAEENRAGSPRSSGARERANAPGPDRVAAANSRRGDGSGWYQRRRDGTAPAGETAPAGATARISDPPSVLQGPYTVAQPQPERHMGDRGVAGPAGPATRWR